jgi:hypothetical protein
MSQINNIIQKHYDRGICKNKIKNGGIQSYIYIYIYIYIYTRARARNTQIPCLAEVHRLRWQVILS